MLPTLRASRGASSTETVLSEVALLPTPAVNDMGAAYTPEEWDAWTAEMKAKHNNGNGHGKSLNVEAQRLLPTPVAREGEKASMQHSARKRIEQGRQPFLTHVIADLLRDNEAALLPTPRATDGTKGGPNQRGSSGDLMLPSAVNLLPTPKDAWGEYELAIRRWEVATRPAPEPTKPNAKGNPKLSDLFDEWLMGLPAGWITNVPGITWNETLKACGNGVVPQQCVAALIYLRRLSAL